MNIKEKVSQIIELNKQIESIKDEIDEHVCHVAVLYKNADCKKGIDNNTINTNNVNWEIDSSLVDINYYNRDTDEYFNFCFSIQYLWDNNLLLQFQQDCEAIEKALSPADINAQRQENIGFGHISVKPLKNWLRIIDNAKLSVERVAGTGGPFFGSPLIDAHRVLFALMVLFDTLFEWLSFSYIWSENLLFELKKKEA